MAHVKLPYTNLAHVAVVNPLILLTDTDVTGSALAMQDVKPEPVEVFVQIIYGNKLSIEFERSGRRTVGSHQGG